MNVRLVKLDEFSGIAASVYSLLDLDKNQTLFDVFLQENLSFNNEIKSILYKINTISSKKGAREDFFTLNEGTPGDGVVVLFDSPKRKLRLYCIRFNKNLIILGGGGEKTTRTYQEDPKLHKENKILRQISQKIDKRLAENEIEFINEFSDFTGNLDFEL